MMSPGLRHAAPRRGPRSLLLLFLSALLLTVRIILTRHATAVLSAADGHRDLTLNAPLPPLDPSSVGGAPNHVDFAHALKPTPEDVGPSHTWHKVSFRGQTFSMAGHGEDDYTTKIYLKRGNFYETSVAEGILRYQERYGGDVLDVGMNIGSVSVPVAHFCKGCRVIGIEAMPANFQKAVANGRINGLSNLIPIQAALQDRRDVTSASFEINEDNKKNMGSIALAQTGSGGIAPASKAGVQQVTVRATTLDELRSSMGNVRVAKFDIEGSELIAIRGGLTWLEESPPCVIIMEVDKIDLVAMTSLLEGKGFIKFAAGREGIQTVTDNVVFKSTKSECK